MQSSDHTCSYTCTVHEPIRKNNEDRLISPLPGNHLWLPECSPASGEYSPVVSEPENTHPQNTFQHKWLFKKKKLRDWASPITSVQNIYYMFIFTIVSSFLTKGTQQTYSKEIWFKLNGSGQIWQGWFRLPHGQKHSRTFVISQVILWITLCMWLTASKEKEK